MNKINSMTIVRPARVKRTIRREKPIYSVPVKVSTRQDDTYQDSPQVCTGTGSSCIHVHVNCGSSCNNNGPSCNTCPVFDSLGYPYIRPCFPGFQPPYPACSPYPGFSPNPVGLFPYPGPYSGCQPVAVPLVSSLGYPSMVSPLSTNLTPLLPF